MAIPITSTGTRGTTEDGLLARLVPLTGVLFGALFFADLVLTDLPDVGDTNARTLAFYADAAHRRKEVVAAYLLVAAALAFVAFASGLRERIRRSRHDTPQASLLVFAGSAFLAVWLAAGAAFAAPVASLSLHFTGAERIDPEFARSLSTLGDVLLLGYAAVPAALFVAATSTLLLRAAQAPRWFGWMGLGCAVAIVAATFTFFWLLVFPAWTAAIGIVLALRRDLPRVGDVAADQAVLIRP